MADLSLVTNNFLPTASETFTDNLSGSISAGATTVPVNSAVEYADGDVAVLTVDPGTANEATFVGKKDVGSNQFIECIWTEGNTSVGHDAGATIIDYDSATHFNLLSKALKGIMNQNGTLKDQPIRDALGLSDASTNGWEVFPYTFTVSSGYNKGNGLYDMTVANQDVTGLLSEGMKLRTERNVVAPTQCLDLDSATSQYASVSSPTGISFTDDWTAEAWIKPKALTGSVMQIVNRLNGTTEGWSMRLNSAGRIEAVSQRIASNNRVVTSDISPQIGRWSHVAVSMDNSANAHAIYLNGVSITARAVTTGTITALVQGTGPLRIGALSSSASLYFNGKIADVRVWNVIRSATEIQDNMNQQLTGSETNLVAYYKLNGDLQDSTSNNNHMTGSGGAVATNSEHIFKTTQYLEVASVSYSAPNSTVKVIAPEEGLLANMVITSPYYSTQENPFGYPADTGINTFKYSANNSNINPAGTPVDFASAGAAVLVTVPRDCIIQVEVGMVCGSTNDYEFRPRIYLDGSSVAQLDFHAAAGVASSRGTYRGFTYPVLLTAGSHVLSAGISLASAAAAVVNTNGAFVKTNVGKVTAR